MRLSEVSNHGRAKIMAYRWVVRCKNCGAEITFQIADETPPAERQPSKPAMRNHSEAMKCPLCKIIADYEERSPIPFVVSMQFRGEQSTTFKLRAKNSARSGQKCLRCYEQSTELHFESTLRQDPIRIALFLHNRPFSAYSSTLSHAVGARFELPSHITIRGRLSNEIRYP